MKLKYILLVIGFQAFGQEVPNFMAIDSLYREDQFYASISYNALQNLPTGVVQKKFTPSFSFGFLRDMPINKKRTVAVAVGLGFSINNYNQNLLIDEIYEKPDYNIISNTIAYDRNKLVLHYIDLPIEFRWRTSTPDTHKFYRIYGGFKASYLINSYSKFVGSQELLIENNPDLNNLQYGTYLTFGYNFWNFFAYYGLNPIFNDNTKLNNKNIDMRTLNFGLIFYIL